MGSVGSGASSQRAITMRSVGTRTTPNGPLAPALPPNSVRRRLDDRSFSADRLPAPATKTAGVTANEHSERAAASHNANRQHTVNGERLLSNASFSVRREPGHRRGESLDLCGNSIVLNNNNNENKNSSHQAPAQQHKDKSKAKTDNHNPPNMMPLSGKLDQAQAQHGLSTEGKDADALVRPSAFKPVVPKSFHSMQNLVCPLQTSVGAGGGSSGSGAGDRGGQGTSGVRPDEGNPNSRGTHSGGGIRAGQGSLSDSGRNSLTSLPTYAGTGSGYGPPPALGPLSASTSHINQLGTATAGLDKPDKPGYQNGLSASDSGHSSSGKSSSSYQRLSHLSDAPAPLRPSPSSDDVIRDLEDRLWEREQEVRTKVLHMRRNLDQSEAAIVQVFEEKQRVWEREMEELRQNYAGRLQQVTRRAQRSQQALQAQISRLQQDKRRLQDEMTLLLAQREELEKKCLDYRKEQADLLPKLEETKWEVTVLRDKLSAFETEVAGLKKALSELSSTSSTRTTESSLADMGQLVLSRSRERLFSPLSPPETPTSLPPLSSLPSVSSLPPVPSLPPLPALPAPDPLLSLQSDDSKVQRQEAGDLRRQLELLQGELRLERQQRERQALTFAHERQTWQGEKERVLKYQAQLQLSYVEMLQKNQALEERVDQLGAQLSTPILVSPATPTLSPHSASLEVPTAAPVAVSITSPTPPVEEKKVPALHQLAPPWPVPTRLERIESTEI
ncbi:leucine zipper putative tumor suppressor 3 isoform 3-T3 [Clarias gariepinus]|uniref:leucine zipper putative tumor suppressor 3 isoform X3 n=1 Tax=Clarias gariepinus TaxID=13013 RepID=UPI00234D2954|nr:leucine zipper putative tumor suppressor 3 isoform X3 [Clarias gariepinus]